MSYREDISIDRNDLRFECARQPTLVFTYHRRYAEALRERRRAEKNLEIAAADADAKVRRRSRSNSSAKITESEIKRMIAKEPGVLKANDALQDIAHEVHVLEGALKALDAKTRLLRELVAMALHQYQSEPGKIAGTARADETRVGIEEGRAAQIHGLNKVRRK